MHRVMTWYGDDFTGSAAVMEVLTFAGLKSVLFLSIPSDDQLARFAGHQCIGLASTARAQSPEWMEQHLPPAFEFLDGLGAPLLHYKICSTLDSAPETGSIGKAIEIGLRHRQAAVVPVVVAAPQMRRYQVFGNLFAGSLKGTHRLDRHPVMSRHPVTPMLEADVTRHLATQTDLPVGCLDMEMLATGDTANTALTQAIDSGSRILALDVYNTDSETIAGQLLWENRAQMGLVVGSQGIEYCLVRHWQSAGLLDPAPPPAALDAHDQIVAVSGSVSPTTEAQVDWAAQNGFRIIRFDVIATCGTEHDRRQAEAHAVEAAMNALGAGDSPLVCSASGLEDPSIAALRSATAAADLPLSVANARIGASLGRILDNVLQRSGIRRAVISGGDTSGHGLGQMGIYALGALAPTLPGAPICTSYSDGIHDGLQIALKGGQMGNADFFGHVRAGGGPR